MALRRGRGSYTSEGEKIITWEMFIKDTSWKLASFLGFVYMTKKKKERENSVACSKIFLFIFLLQSCKIFCIGIGGFIPSSLSLLTVLSKG